MESIEKREELDNLFPPAIIDYIKSVEPTFRNKTPEELPKLQMETTGKLAEMLKEHLLSNAPETANLFKQNLIAFEKHLEDASNRLGKPVLHVNQQERDGIPAGARVISFENPFHNVIALVKEDGKLKIFFIMTQVLPD